MNTAYLLVMLTFNAADQASLSFASTETLEQCRLKGQALSGILQSSGIEVREHRCVESEQRFSRYRHGGTAEGQPLATYRVVFREDSVDFRLLPESEPCVVSQPGAYCATSLQKPLD